MSPTTDRSERRGQNSRFERGRQNTAPTKRLPHAFAMTWRWGLFAHWPVDPEALEPHVPDPLELDTWNGWAWVGVLPFVLADAGIRGTPRFARISIPEVNVRTYVTYRGDPAVFFFSIDLGAPRLLALLGRATRLPVSPARIRVYASGESVSFASERRDGRARFDVTVRPSGEEFVAEPGSFPYWATARRRLYAPENGRVLCAEIAHEPWPLQPATVEIRENTMFEASDLPESIGEPIVHYCGELPMTGSIARRLLRSEA